VSGWDPLPYYPNNLAAQLAESEEVEKADAFFRTALELAPDAACLNYNYGTFLVKQLRDAEALAHLDRAIHAGWDDADAWVNRGVALSRLDRGQEARESFETAVLVDIVCRYQT